MHITVYSSMCFVCCQFVQRTQTFALRTCDGEDPRIIDDICTCLAVYNHTLDHWRTLPPFGSSRPPPNHSNTRNMIHFLWFSTERNGYVLHVSFHFHIYCKRCHIVSYQFLGIGWLFHARTGLNACVCVRPTSHKT